MPFSLVLAQLLLNLIINRVGLAVFLGGFAISSSHGRSQDFFQGDKFRDAKQI